MSSEIATSLLSEALGRMRQGIVVVARDGERIAFVNEAFRDMFGLDEADCRPGTALADMIRLLAARGEYGDEDPDEAAAARLRALRRGEPWDEIRQRGNGRVLQVTGTPLPNGQLYSYADVTREWHGREQMRRGYKAAVVALADLAEHRDGETGDHVLRVASLTHEIALTLRQFGGHDDELTEDICSYIGTASILHDVGKVTIPDAILLKPGPLAPEERLTMQGHAEAGSAILQQAALLAPESPYFSLGNQIALSHHERFDGKGYPQGLAGTDIPLPARIAAVADVFDALVSERPYKPAWPVEKAVAVIRENAGTQFDPEVVAAFVLVMEERSRTPLIQWTPDLSVGDGALDRDHRHLLGLLNQLVSPRCRNDRTTLEMVLDELVAYTAGHFAREEAHMARLGFPELQRHRRIHRRLTDNLLSIRSRFVSSAGTDLGDEIATFLTRWLRDHIMREDMRYERFAAQVSEDTEVE